VPLHGHWVVEPWEAEVGGDALLHDIIARFRRHVVFERYQSIAVALWTLMAWVHEEAATHSPILLATSAEANSGKTTLINLVGFLVPRGLSSVGIPEAALFRSIELWQPTVIVDEADTALVDNEPLRAVINSGWTRGTGAVRCVGEDHVPHLFPTFAPKALGMKGRRLPDTTMSRCIIIDLKRKRPGERADHFKHIDDDGLAELWRKALRWANDHGATLKVAAEPDMPAGFDNRLGDNWWLLFQIAERAGGDWPVRARDAAAALSGKTAQDESVGVKLLGDIRAIFAERDTDRLSSADLVAALAALEDRPWVEWKGGKPLTPNGLARLLTNFHISSGNIRTGPTTTPKGYQLAHFTEAFERYL
jgi:putative DNA primase/helicase